MCGIAGIVNVDRARPASAESLSRMCEAMHHRGPDDSGMFIDGRVGLAMRRLSIIDLESGRQPIFNEDRSKVIVFNGEIYNYRDLRDGLVAGGHRFRTRTDTETIIHLHEDLGPDCVEKLRGMFAFAIWDENSETLLLARDRFGIKPLYILRAPWGIAFASELKALHAAGFPLGELNWTALDSYFKLGYIPAPLTPFDGVSKLEAGHLLIWQPGREPLCRQYWDLPLSAETDGRREENILQWLDESVEAHLVSDVPVAVFLSGGLDSSAVVSSMALTGPPPHAYTARYRGSEAAPSDETHLARALSERYDARLTIVDVEPDLREIFEPIVRALDEPHADESAIPFWLISQRIAEQYKVALVGTGGDEMFAGYRRHLGLILSGVYGKIPGSARRLISRLVAMIPEPRGAGLTLHRLKRFLQTGNGPIPSRYFDLLNRLQLEPDRFYSQDILNVITDAGAEARFDVLHRKAGSPSGLRAGLYLDYKTYLPDDLLHLSDRIAMAHSLEVRVPFVDHVFVERAFPISDRRKIGYGQNKRLLKQALRPRLPKQHIGAPKRGFVGPTAVWLRHELRDMLEDELSSTRMARLGYFNQQTVDSLLQDHFNRHHNREGVLWALLCFSTWHRQFIEGGAKTSNAFMENG